MTEAPRLVAAALYVYTSDSPFSILVNSYMSDGSPIIPIVSESQLNTLRNVSLARNIQNLALSNLTALGPGQVTLLD